VAEHLEAVVHGLAPADPRDAEYGVLVSVYRRG
jgi:hypothetical protein